MNESRSNTAGVISMNRRDYQWKRFWCRRDGRISLSDNGYLSDPEQAMGFAFSPGVESYEKLAHVHCLILLGEAGIGKSRCIASIVDEFNSNLDEPLAICMMIDLADHGDEKVLVEDIFDSPEYSSWLSSNKALYMFLDTFDVCHTRINNLPKTIARITGKMRNEKANSFFLRLACRTGLWPSSLERNLIELWGEENVEIREMAPLRRSDVRVAAAANDLDVEEFLAEVDQANVVPLAIKPVTLEFLLREFKNRDVYQEQAPNYIRLAAGNSARRAGSGKTGSVILTMMWTNVF